MSFQVIYSTESLERDVARGGWGFPFHADVARQLLRLDTIDRRSRAYDEAQTMTNLYGGRPSQLLADTVTVILNRIERGTEDEALPGEAVLLRQYENEVIALRARFNLPAVK